MLRGWPAVKVTDVSEGGGPEVSSTTTRANGNTRETVGTAGVPVAGGLRAPQPRITPSDAVPSTVAQRPSRWDIADGRKRER